ncbi:MAG: methyltransferase domain-containing protein [Rickettsiales bacterium]|nr:methyltransferase domain-containing protein [Rickettsiales bacterium]
MTNETLFDRNLLRQNRQRAMKNFEQHNFLHHEVANRIAENVEFLNREFDRVLEIGACGDCVSSKVKVTDFCVDEESLPNEPESFDLILSNLNFHFINEIPQFLLQVKALLKPNGVFIASFFGEENLSQLAHALYETENEIYAGVSPRMPPTIDVKTAANLLAKAGFQNPISDFAKIEVEYGEPLNLLKDLKNMGQGNILTKRSRKFFTKKFLQKISENYKKIYSNEEGEVTATFEVVTVTGWKMKD